MSRSTLSIRRSRKNFPRSTAHATIPRKNGKNDNRSIKRAGETRNFARF